MQGEATAERGALEIDCSGRSAIDGASKVKEGKGRDNRGGIDAPRLDRRDPGSRPYIGPIGRRRGAGAGHWPINVRDRE